MRRLLLLSTLLAFASGWAAPAHAAEAGDGHTLTRFPTLHGGTIVFAAHGNLWQVARAGGVAQRLTADTGEDVMPRFSPDGKWIAFTASYDGNGDVYVIPAGGGAARRLTFHSDVTPKAPDRWGPNNMVLGWTPDSTKIEFLSRRMAWNDSYMRPFEVPLAGGLPGPMTLDRGGLMSWAPDGHTIAYTRIMRDFRIWKRYDGGMSQDVYTYDFNTKKLDRITDFAGTDTAPMWYGNRIYFLSDRDANRRANIWCYDLGTKQFREITHFTDYDIDFPSISGPGGDDAGIVFQQGGSLYVIDLPSETLHKVDVRVPDDGTRTMTRTVKTAKYVTETDTSQTLDYAISPNGKRAALVARGDLYTLPAEHGATRNLTDSSGAFEDHPSWSPDGKTIAYTTDASGERQIAVRPAEGGAEKLLTHFSAGFFYKPVFSPDGSKLAFSDNEHRLWIVPVSGGDPKAVAHDPYSEIHDQNWSPDGRWLAWSQLGPNQQRTIWLYDSTTGHAEPAADPMNSNWSPVFSPDGRYLWFISNRHENPAASDRDFDFTDAKSNGLYLATLSADTPSPFVPRSDEGTVGNDAKPGHDDGKWHPGNGPAVHLTTDGLMSRATALPGTEGANILGIDARGSKLYWQTAGVTGFEGPLPGEKSTLHVYDLADRKTETVIDALDSYEISADGSAILFKHDDDWTITEAKPKGEAHKLSLDAMVAQVTPPAEWAEMFEDAWRLERDFFYSTKYNGVNWQGVHDAYAKLEPLVGSRGDLTYVLGQMQGEMGNSHTYAGGGDDLDPTPHVATVLLGVDYALDAASGRYQFARIYPGDNTRPAYRSPLTEPGINVHPGDYLLAVNGHELKAPTNPYSLFVGLEGPVTITVAAQATGARRDITVDPLKSELNVRELDWIDTKRRTVDRLSGGRVAYIYMSDMESLGLEQFMRQFYPQTDKRALLMDDRFNGGGFVDQLVLERLRRVLVGMSTNRQRIAAPIPQLLIDGPKVALLNHYSASDGDIFPFFFRKYGLGKLIGTRSWGGVRGIRGYWGLLDGGYITIPEDSLYGLGSEWVMENHGVDPDITVEDTPDEMLSGHDPQLARGVNELLDELKSRPASLPPAPPLLPAYPPADQNQGAGVN